MDNPVRVRFAPSPTGYLHIGGARTALFNWLFARHEKGAFIVRIENTDVERSSDELEGQMLDDLAWLGFVWDEGPGRGGRFGPYRQSERIAMYRECAERLVHGGRAFACFCTDEELARKREEKLKKGLPPQYDGTCRELSEEERSRRRREGRPESVRFLFPEGVETSLDDIVRENVVFPPGMVGDFVIMRSNGLPTYNFAAAVDDALMRITHVIRGEEHLSNTLRQMVIYDALGFDQPRFAHIPLILGSDRTKLSKRHGAPNIRDYRAMGIPAGAVVNFLALLGWSPPDNREILTVDELIERFDLDRVSNSPSIFDEVKLHWVSAQHIRAGGSGRYFSDALPYFPEDLRRSHAEGTLREIFDIVSENLPSFSHIPAEVGPFRPGVPDFDDGTRGLLAGAAELLAAFTERFESCTDWSRDGIRAAVGSVGKKAGVKGRDLFMPLRVALTGTTHGPDLSSIVAIRGREDVLGVLTKVREICCG